MRKLFLFYALLFSFMFGSVHAQEPDCKEPQTQFDMNECARQDFVVADLELNKVYKQVRQNSKDISTRFDDHVVKAQRAWIVYRDAECEMEGMKAEGGSMQPLLQMSCLASETNRRTDELKELAESLTVN